MDHTDDSKNSTLILCDFGIHTQNVSLGCVIEECVLSAGW